MHNLLRKVVLDQHFVFVRGCFYFTGHPVYHFPHPADGATAEKMWVLLLYRESIVEAFDKEILKLVTCTGTNNFGYHTITNGGILGITNVFLGVLAGEITVMY